MKIIKRSMLFLLMIVTLMTGVFTLVNAQYTMVSIPKMDGGNVLHRGTQIEAKMPSEYVLPESDFRAVWISNLVGDIAPFVNEAQYKAEITRVLDVMQHFNMNVMIFHIRMFNNALYPSALNPVATYYSTVDFDEFDPLEWIIEESHKRGIEFHAWLNPYRVASGGTVTEAASKFASHNVASNPDYLLKGINSIILDPGEPEVRDFLIDTVMEVIEKYDVDAIHFDDYFYDNGVNDDATRAKYNTTNMSMADFRREQVNIFIEDLSDTMRQYNDLTGRLVQLGISPSGIYRNGSYVSPNNYTYDNNGNLTYPLFSNTAGFDHYGAYLYADTLKWVRNEWIDYILPQSYWALEHPSAGFADVIDWWGGALKYSKVNLYSGLGLYMIASSGTTYSWKNNPLEASRQVQYSSQHAAVKGHAIFSFQHVANAYDSKSDGYYQNMIRIKNQMWFKPAIIPEIKTYAAVNLPRVDNLKLSKTSAGYRIDFDSMDNAKSYAIYRSNTVLSYSSAELINVLGTNENNGVVSYIDQVDTNTNYVYGVRPISITNTLGLGLSVPTQTASENGQLLHLRDFDKLSITDNTYSEETIDIKWDVVFPLYGGKAQYAVFSSYDGIEWQKVATPLINTSTHHLQKLVLPTNQSKIYVQIKAFNDTSESLSPIYEIDIVNNIGTITNFTVIGEVYAGNQVIFKWNLLKNFDDVVYKVQSSPNGDHWTDITSVSNPVVITGVNAIQQFTLPSNRSHHYYRVYATTATGKTISTPIRINSFEYIGKINLKINGVPYSGPLTVNEMDVLLFTWDNLSHKDQAAVYTTRMSTNLQTWQLARLFNSTNTLVVGEFISTQRINIDFRYYTLYVQVEATTVTGRSLSEIVELKVVVNTLMLTPYMQNHFNIQNAFINSMKIYG